MEASNEADEAEIQQLLRVTQDTTDYYAILGLSQEANPTTTQIRAAYYRLSLAFHPDKHPSYARNAAEEHFTLLQRAYETLVDTRKRVIYDLQGEKGVRAEYSIGGAMMSNANRERSLGVKTMTADEFRRYYIGILKARERKALEDLVESTGEMTATINAHKLFDGSADTRVIQGNEGRPIRLPVSRLRIMNIGLSQSFHVPLPDLPRLLKGQVMNFSSGFEEDSGDDRKALVVSEIPVLTISGGIGGALKDLVVIHADTDDSIESPRPYTTQSLHDTENINFAAGLSYNISDAGKEQNAGLLRRVLANTNVSVLTTVLPRRNVVIGFDRVIPFFQAQHPFMAYVRTTFENSLLDSPPTINCKVVRQIAKDQVTSIHWNSGDLTWPTNFKEILPMNQGTLWLPFGQAPTSLELGWNKQAPSQEGDDDSSSSVTQDLANPSWHVTTTATPQMAYMQLLYGRSVFVNSRIKKPRSRMRADENIVPAVSTPRDYTSRGLRVQIQVETSLALSLSVSLRAVRPIGSFTTISFGVGFNAASGLFITIAWRRLGQGISLPILLFPTAEMTKSAVLWTIGIPCILYTTIEFAILRPILRAQKARIVEKTRKELNASISKNRSKAIEAQTLMTTLTEHKRAQEGELGLLILSAIYGVPTKSSKSSSTSRKIMFTSGQSADVTIAVQAMVNDGQASIPRGVSKGHMTGFWDPAPLVRKVLVVRYLWLGEVHEAVAKDSEGLRIPMRKHVMDG